MSCIIICWSSRFLCIWCRSIRANTAHLIPAFLYMCPYACLSFFSVKSGYQDQDMLNAILVFYLTSLREIGKGLWIGFAVWEWRCGGLFAPFIDFQLLLSVVSYFYKPCLQYVWSPSYLKVQQFKYLLFLDMFLLQLSTLWG